MRENPIFQAYVNLSPDFLGNITESISKRFAWIEKDYIYYMATSDKDIVNKVNEAICVSLFKSRLCNTVVNLVLAVCLVAFYLRYEVFKEYFLLSRQRHLV